MTCSKLHTVYKDQEKKVVTHDRKWYEQNIRNRIFSQNALQRRIEDSDAEQQLSNGKMCVVNGTVYRSGSAMTSSSLCTYCYCIEGKQKCIQPKCTLPAKGCEPILIDSSCCPVRYDCTENKIIKARYNTKYNRRRNDNKHYLRMTSRMQRSRGCLFNSTFYPEGHKLPANQTNPCEICFCIGGSKRCAPKKCAPMIRNCRPIIPDGQCCPSSYDCKTVSDHKTARGFISRQYSDLFSLFFGDEDKENSTASWDYETETESISAELNATNEKGLLDVIKDSLNYVDGNKQTAEQQTNVPNQIVQSIANLPSYNVSDGDDGNGGGDDDDDDDEEISLLDFFLKGESEFTSTTTKPFVFNVTGKPLLNGMTNSPMQIQPILPDNMKNDSIRFSMLPMSLYNMVKDDGTVMFDGEKANQSQQIVSSHPLGVSNSKHAIKEIESDVSPIKSHVIHAPTISSDVKTTTHSFVSVTKPSTSTQTSTSAPKAKPHNDLNVRVSNETAKINKTESVSVKSAVNKTESSRIETTTEQKISVTTTPKSKPTKSSVNQNMTKSTGLTTKRIITTSTIKPTVKVTSTTPKIDATTVKTAIKTTVKTTAKTTTKPTTTKAPLIESTTASMQPLTTKSTTIPKITAVQINSNPSILETDVSYDYSEPTLPPSLPNLKIIPFLPTDAVKNIIHRNDGYKSNYNYYQSSSNHYAGPETHVENTAYSPFNVKPNIEKYPTYTVADDRIDYDSYKMPAENVDGLDYINVYSNGGNMIQPTSFQLSVNSKLDYGTTDQKVVPSKIPPIVNKNLTVKPPLPPFEPEHEYHLYNPPPKPQLELGNGYNEYSVNGPISNDPFPSEHNYNVPHFVTMPPLKEPQHRPVANKDTVFSYGGKNKFIPPAKTEGGFVPKRTNGENYIPLHGSNYYADSKEDETNSLKNSSDTPTDKVQPNESEEKTKTEESNQTTSNLDKYIISITTEKDFKIPSLEEYNDAFLGVDILGPYKKQSEEYEVASDNDQNTANAQLVDHNISFNSLYGVLFSDEEHVHTPSTALTASKSSNTTSTTTTKSTTSTSTPKPPSKNLTDNAIPLKLITIINNTKKENPTKVEIPQRKNNKIIDPTDEPLVENLPTTELPSSTTSEPESSENLAILRDVFFSSLNRAPIVSSDISEDLLHKSPIFLSRPINKFGISTAGFSNLNSLESKHNFQTNPIRSELDLIIPELNKNKHNHDFSHTNNFSSENYQVLPADDTNISNTESYVVNPVDVDKLKEHHSNGETKIYTPPHKDPAGLLKLAGCNIYGRMYRVGRIIAELSSSCLECRCTEVGVSCTPLNC
ncbi:uncharacterized protein LOC129568021 isoform X2 [Sitodiplosis mosellana]|nr:uncharacterized protein LOC129568021 isoform X2 [Sitodiplosis mosellana]